MKRCCRTEMPGAPMEQPHPPHHHCGCRHSHHPMKMLVMLGSLVTGFLLLFRMARALEMLALASSLDEMDDRLTEIERADLEGRIRAGLFSE